MCLSVTLHLTSRVFVRLTKDMTYLTGNEGQNLRTVFSETTAFERYGVITSEKANMLMSTGLPGPALARFAHPGGIRRYSKVEYRLQCGLNWCS